MPRLTAPVKLSGHVYLVYSEFPHIDSGNVYFIAGAHPTLIDCGSQRGFPQLQNNLSQLGVRISDLEQVIATHGDYDHVQGFHELYRLHPDHRLRLHRSDWPIVQESDPYRNASYLYRRPFVCFQEEQCQPLDDGDVTSAGDGHLTVHHTPGHTEGSICLLGLFDDIDILFAGDAIGGAMRTLDGASLGIWAQAAATWQQSLLRLMALDFDWVLNGHEPASSLPMHRSRIDQMAPMFGKMLNPWFSLEVDDVETSGLDDTVVSGY